MPHRSQHLPTKTSLFLASLALPAALLLLGGCAKVGCLTGTDPECTVPSPCPQLEFTCDSGSVSISTIKTIADVPGGMDALGAIGDYVLSNDQVTVVIDSLDHPHYLAPTGGAILDFVTAAADNDSLRHIFQAAGVLPDEAANYTSARIIQEEGLVAVQFMGTLFERPDMPIATRYELRPCEPGLRVRTELVNREPEPFSIMLSDGYYFGGRELLPFAPGPGRGFNHPSFGLSTLGDAIGPIPYLVTAGHTEPAASYATVSCSAEELYGFQSDNVAANGLKARPIQPRDYAVFERFIAAADGSGVSGAADIALELRSQIFDEPWAELSGQVVVDGSDQIPLDDGLRASVLVSEGFAAMSADERSPWTHTLLDAEGRFTVRVPANRDYVLTVESYGVETAVKDVSVGSDATDAGTLSIPAVGRLTIDATIDGAQDHVYAFVLPADDATESSTRGAMFGQFVDCAPLLGSPYGGSPACNRVLIDGPTSFGLLPGTYDVFASAGPFSTLAAERGIVVSEESDVAVNLQIDTLPLQPAGVLSADFHVHGGASFDSNVPDYDRVRALLAARVDVIAATDHDVVYDYADAIAALGAADRLELLVGIETTGHILFKILPDSPFPQVVGHWNLWPLEYDPLGPYRGGAWDELAQPGEIMTRMAAAGWDSETGICQLNHPIEEAQFGRDLGYATTLDIDATMDLPADFDGSPMSTFLYTPKGSDFANADYHTQEVMNGTENLRMHSYRAFWWYLLNQGIVRAGTANSDSHSLTENVLGTPRTLVWTSTDMANFDQAQFNADVRKGRMIGTNGPVIEVSTLDSAGGTIRPDTRPFEPVTNGSLDIVVTAAPWVPIEEVRIIVNGETVLILTDELSHPSDPFGSADTDRLNVSIPLADLLPANGDAWLVVEAGKALEPNEDLDCNGFPDTGDNNRDGTIDWRDVEALEEDPEMSCFDDTGPLTEPPAPEGREGADYFFRTVTPGGYPMAFTNPLFIDSDGNGFAGAGR